MFSQVEFKNLDINWYAKNILLLFEAFLKGLNDHKYPLIFDNLKYEDLFDETLIRKRIIQESKSKINSELWKYLSNWKITRKPMVNPLDDSIFDLGSTVNNSALAKIKFKEYEFYLRHINLSK